MQTARRRPRVETKAKSRTRWGDGEGRRRDILRAARRVLERDGYDALGIRDVARGAGVSPGTVYTYFASREQLFAALYAERLLALDAELAPLCAQATSPEALLVAIAERYFEVYRVFGRELNLWSVLVGTHAFPEEVAAPLMAAANRVLATVMTAAERVAAGFGLRLGELRDGGLAVPWVWATLSGLADHYTGKRHLMHGRSREELVRFAARMIVAGLSSLAPSPPPAQPAAAKPAAAKPAAAKRAAAKTKKRRAR
jgi:AcrR family transcriptional regulator